MTMLTWNNRIVFHNDVYEVREVFYEDDAPTGHGSAFLSGDSVDDLRKSYEKIQEAFSNGAPVLREEDFAPLQDDRLKAFIATLPRLEV